MFTAAIVLALLFSLTNGVHDASNAIATLVATRAATPAQAIVLAAVCGLAGPLLVGAAVADTIGAIVIVPGSAGVRVIAGALLAAVTWNALTWLAGLPSSSGHALVGGLAGAGLAQAGTDAIRWGGLDGLHPVGIAGTVIGLAVAPVLGAGAAAAAIGAVRRLARRATARLRGPTRAGQWAMAGALAFSHGANDAQKSVGVIAALLVADGRATSLGSPTWAILASATALTVGTAMGGWRIVHTVGRRIYRLHPIDSLASQTASAGVILGASLLGAPVSTTQVVASSVVGVGAGRRRMHHVHWTVVRHMGLAWVVTVPATGAIAALAVLAGRAAA
ncbi:inorganic phosphate transporter [Baekduia soli]|uniref:Inorganic phosphate transporter n=1 Tax=Baekduia soli TaxID=496014 RepID=A0A5B8U9H5_9ACTN|nr:inorganic phosphate transporter [Baekduia soli]QEC49806.1 inorganic phosphate transporter [Baekduia soli]